MSCPLCDHPHSRPSWVGVTVFRGREFPYVECCGCATIYCDPMPDDAVVAEMYGTEYCSSNPHNGESMCGMLEDPRQSSRVIAWLARNDAGVFIDYGCRDGSLLEEAKRLGWRAVGVEIDKEVAQSTSERTGLQVVTPSEAELTNRRADVVHLGDVIEHLTKMNEQLPQILRLLKPGGTLIAQGPLEANANLFTWSVKTARSVRGVRRTDMPPFHVLLATTSGQRGLFTRFGLSEIEYDLSEVSWPAPARLSLADFRNARAIAMFALRRCSQLTSALRPRVWGNRYFYVGVKSSSHEAATWTMATPLKKVSE